MNDRALSAGRASYATLSYLSGRAVPAVSIRQPIDHGAEVAPKSGEAIETAISLLLAAAVGEMLHLGADGRHLAADRPEVQRALALAAQLGDGDPVDAIEPVFDDLCATLTSPRVKHAVAALAGALLRAPAGEMASEDVLEMIVLAMAVELPVDADQSAHPRRIWIR